MHALLKGPRFAADHRWLGRKMSAYVDDELQPRHQRRAHRHLGVCPECRRALAALRRTLDSLAELAREPAPDIAEAMVERLRHQP